MPVESGVEVRTIDQERFHALDKVVMRHVFNIHNELGRFCDERVYQEELARRCRTEGFEVHRELPFRAVYQGFSKTYYLDLLVNRGVIYELKAVEALNHTHQMQLINYLLLVGLSHGKLVNLRPTSVESRFVSTSLCHQDRITFRLADSGWKGNDPMSHQLHKTLRALLEDWGAFLDANLYREALLSFLNGPGAGVQPIDIEVNSRVVGTQKMCMLNAETAWHLYCVRQDLASYETHLLRLLRHTRLDKMHWINLNQRDVTLKTLARNDSAVNGSVAAEQELSGLSRKEYGL